MTITATTNNSAATVSGSDTTGFYLENFFSNDPNDEAITNTLVSGDLTSAANASDGSPSIFRGGSGTDPGLNVWSYTNDPTSDFTAGSQAFSGSGTWSLTPEDYAAMLTAPTSGNIYFVADTVDDIAGATLIGTYTVNATLSRDDFDNNAFTYGPNPVKDVLNLFFSEGNYSGRHFLIC